MSTNKTPKASHQNASNLPPTPSEAFAKLAAVTALGAGMAWLASRYADQLEQQINDKQINDKQRSDTKSANPKQNSQKQSTQQANKSLKENLSDVVIKAFGENTTFANTSTAQPSVPQQLKGQVIRTSEEFSLTTEEGVSYHVYDPHRVLARMARDRGVYDPFYTLNRVRIYGIISGVGSYGHLGQFERQITVVKKP